MLLNTLAFSKRAGDDMKKATRKALAIITATSLLAMVAAGCGGTGDVCQDASKHMESCFGAAGVGAISATCDPDKTEQLLQMSCTQLASSLSDSKADNGLSSAVWQAVRKSLLGVLQPVLETAIKEAIAQVSATLGIDLSDKLEKLYFYPVLFKAATEAEAQAKADAFRSKAGRAFNPQVVAYDEKFIVIADKCPWVGMSKAISGYVAMLLDSPGVFEALGGRIEKKSEYLGFKQTINIHMPADLHIIAQQDKLLRCDFNSTGR